MLAKALTLEAFLSKFESHSRYFGWTGVDRLFQLQNSLTGTAATVLWAGHAQNSSAELLSLRNDQHSSDHQTERF